MTFFPLSEMTFQLMNLRKLLLNDTESRLGTRSNTIPLLDAHVYSVTQTLWRVQLLVFEVKIYLTYSGPKLSIPVLKYAKVSLNLNLVTEGVAGYW